MGCCCCAGGVGAVPVGKDMSEPKLAWVGVVALAMRDGIARLPDHNGGIYERKIDDQWRVVMNGNKTPASHDGIELAPFSIYVEFNGWPAGVIDPGGGIIAAGEAANEDTFIAAIERALGGDIIGSLA